MLARAAIRFAGAVALLVGSAAIPMNAAAQEYKVGFVNVPKVLDNSPQAEDARQRIEKEFAPRDEEILVLQQQAREVEDRMTREGEAMSSTERNRLERDLRTLRRELRRAQEEFREDLNLRRSQELSKLQREVIEVIQILAKAKKYDLIVGDGVIFAGERIDITGEIISRLKTQFEQARAKSRKNGEGSSN